VPRIIRGTTERRQKYLTGKLRKKENPALKVTAAIRAATTTILVLVSNKQETPPIQKPKAHPLGFFLL
jgi:hypothetical protein